MSACHLVIVEQHGTQFSAGLQPSLCGVAIESHFTPIETVSAVLTGGFHEYGIGHLPLPVCPHYLFRPT